MNGFWASLSSSLAKRCPQKQSSTNILQLSCLQSSCDELWASAQWLAMLFSVVSHPRKVDERPNQSARRRKNPEDSFQLKFGRFHFVAASASWPSGESCCCCCCCCCCLFMMLLPLFFVFVVCCCFCYWCRFSKRHCSPSVASPILATEFKNPVISASWDSNWCLARGDAWQRLP